MILQIDVPEKCPTKSDRVVALCCGVLCARGKIDKLAVALPHEYAVVESSESGWMDEDEHNNNNNNSKNSPKKSARRRKGRTFRVEE